MTDDTTGMTHACPKKCEFLLPDIGEDGLVHDKNCSRHPSNKSKTAPEEAKKPNRPSAARTKVSLPPTGQVKPADRSMSGKGEFSYNVSMEVDDLENNTNSLADSTENEIVKWLKTGDDAKYLTIINDVLETKGLRNLPIPRRDLKIMVLMLKRREEELMRAEMKAQAHRKWREEKEEEEIIQLDRKEKEKQICLEKRKHDEKVTKQIQSMIAESIETKMKVIIEEIKQKGQDILSKMLLEERSCKNMDIQKRKLVNKVRLMSKAEEKKISKVQQRHQEKLMADSLVSHEHWKTVRDKIDQALYRSENQLDQRLTRVVEENKSYAQTVHEKVDVIKRHHEQMVERLTSQLEVKSKRAAENYSRIKQQAVAEIKSRNRVEEQKIQQTQRQKKELDEGYTQWKQKLLALKMEKLSKAEKLVTTEMEKKVISLEDLRRDRQEKIQKRKELLEQDLERQYVDKVNKWSDKKSRIEEFIHKREESHMARRMRSQQLANVRWDLKFVQPLSYSLNYLDLNG